MDKYDISTSPFTLSGIKTYARLVDVYDGDTVTCVFPIFGENYFKFTIRLNGIDTAEMRGEFKSIALEARHKILNYLCEDMYNLNQDCQRSDIQDFLKKNVIIIWLECYNFDKYGRILGDIYKNKDTLSLSDILLNENLAYKYNGGKKTNVDFTKN
jgi:endonuclease YncB( thermonuclease family)